MSKTIGVILALKDKCSPQLSRIAQKMGITEREARSLNKQVERASKTLNKNFKPVVDKAAKASMIFGGVLGGLGLQGLKTAGDFEQYNISFETMLGSQEKAKKLMADITKFAAETPYEMPDLTVGAQRMLAFGIGADVVVDRLGRLGDLAKGDSAILDRLTLAYGKIKAKGKASLEELNQLTEAGVPIMDALAKQLGITTQKLFGYVSDGKIGYKEVEKALISLTSKGGQFYQMTLKQSTSLNGLLSTIQDSWNIMLSDIMQKYLPQIKGVISQLIENMPKIQAAIEPVFVTVGNVIQFVVEHFDTLTTVASGALGAFLAFHTINGVITVIQTLTTVIRAVSAAQGIWNALMLANPVGVAAVAVGGLVAGIVALIKAYKQWQEIKAGDELLKNNSLKELTPEQQAKVDKYNKSKGVKKYAIGTTYTAGGMSLVGEHGPELVNLPKGSGVTPTDKTQKLLNKSSTVVNITIQGNVIGNNEFLNQLADIFSMRLRTALQTT